MRPLTKIVKLLYKWWMAFAHVLAVVNTTLLLSIVYISFLGIASIVVRLFCKDLLKHCIKSTGSFWTAKEPVLHTLEQARHQF
jgi:hypothetical protein